MTEFERRQLRTGSLRTLVFIVAFVVFLAAAAALS